MLINAYRQDPQKLIPFLRELIPQFQGKVYYPKSGQECFMTQEGVLVVYEAIEFVKKQKPLPPFQFSKGLYLASETHCRDIGKHGLASHKGSDGSILSQRIDQFGRWRVLVAENIAFNDNLAEDILINFLLDDGNVNRGHRENLFNGKLRVMGVACGGHSVHSHCCVVTFAGRMEEYLNFKNQTSNLEEVVGVLEEYVGTKAINDLYFEEPSVHSLGDTDTEDLSEIIEKRTSPRASLKGTARAEQVESEHTSLIQANFDSFRKRNSSPKGAKDFKLQEKKYVKSRFREMREELIVDKGESTQGKDTYGEKDLLKEILSQTPSKFNSKKSGGYSCSKKGAQLKKGHISKKTEIRSLKFYEEKVNLVEQEQIIKQQVQKSDRRAKIDQIIIRNKRRRENEKQRIQQVQENKATQKKLKNAENLTEKLNEMNMRLDSYLANHLKPDVHMKKKREGEGEKELAETGQSLGRKYKEIGVNSNSANGKFMRNRLIQLKTEDFEEPQQGKGGLDIEETNNFKLLKKPNEDKAEKENLGSRKEESVGQTEKNLQEIESIPQFTRKEPKKVEHSHNKDKSDMFDDVGVLGRQAHSSLKNEISVPSHGLDSGHSSLNQRGFNYNSAFEMSQNKKTEVIETTPSSQLLFQKKTREDPESPQKKPESIKPDPNDPGPFKKYISFSAIDGDKFVNDYRNFYEFSSSSREEEEQWRGDRAKSIPPKLEEPSSLFDVQAEKRKLEEEKEEKEKRRQREKMNIDVDSMSRKLDLVFQGRKQKKRRRKELEEEKRRRELEEEETRRRDEQRRIELEEQRRIQEESRKRVKLEEQKRRDQENRRIVEMKQLGLDKVVTKEEQVTQKVVHIDRIHTHNTREEHINKKTRIENLGDEEYKQHVKNFIADHSPVSENRRRPINDYQPPVQMETTNHPHPEHPKDSEKTPFLGVKKSSKRFPSSQDKQIKNDLLSLHSSKLNSRKNVKLRPIQPPETEKKSNLVTRKSKKSVKNLLFDQYEKGEEFSYGEFVESEESDTEGLSEFEQRKRIIAQLKKLGQTRQMLEGLDKMSKRGKFQRLSREYNKRTRRNKSQNAPKASKLHVLL